MRKNIGLLLFIFLCYSCENYFGDVNENPNGDITDIQAEDLLPGIEVRLAFVLGGDFSMFTSILVQHVEGVGRCGALNQYTGMTPQRFDPAWREVFTGVLNDLQLLTSLCEEQGLTQFQGVANVLSAYTWMMATDVWGALPFEEAFKGVDVLEPNYDSQEFIYAQIFDLLQQAQTQLAGNATDQIPQAEDFIFNGNAAQWLKAAYALEARAHLHLGARDNVHYAKALELLPMAFQNPAEDMRLPFTAGTNAAPWFQFLRDRTGDVEFHPTLRFLLNNLNDPRLAVYDSPFLAGPHLVLTSNQRVPLISYCEQKFIEAECLYRTGASPTAIRAAYLEGIRTSFDFLELSTFEDYISQNIIDPGEGNIGLEEIMTQKYIALWTEPESFSDWRRTSIPFLQPNSGSEIPRRFNYAQSELDLNSNIPQTSMFNRVWWDVE